MKICLAYEESGAKGYADQDEQFPAQVAFSPTCRAGRASSPLAASRFAKKFNVSARFPIRFHLR